MSADKLAEARQAAETSLGFKIPDVVATSVLWYARANVSWQSSRRATFRFCMKPS